MKWLTWCVCVLNDVACGGWRGVRLMDVVAIACVWWMTLRWWIAGCSPGLTRQHPTKRPGYLARTPATYEWSNIKLAGWITSAPWTPYQGLSSVPYPAQLQLSCP